MMYGATVLSDADPALKRPIFDYASQVCHTLELDLIFESGIEQLIANPVVDDDCFQTSANPTVDRASFHVFEKRELLEARISKSLWHVARPCVIVMCTNCLEDEPGFDISRKILLLERQQIREWCFGSRPFYLFCLTPHMDFIRVTEDIHADAE
jgi:hypothetical protein